MKGRDFISNLIEMKNQKGFTLIEVLIVIGIIAVLAGIVIVAINPARQFAQGNNTTRRSHVNSILNAIGQRIADNRGLFETGCAAGAIPANATLMAEDADNDPLTVEYDIANCLVPTYLPSMPFDPIGDQTDGTADWVDSDDYNTGYTVLQDADGRITVAAPSAQLNEVISVTR
ncbi:MAG TPA: type II secretion system protein [Candidatus Paceibacterota bacterium]